MEEESKLYQMIELRKNRNVNKCTKREITNEDFEVLKALLIGHIKLVDIQAVKQFPSGASIYPYLFKILKLMYDKKKIIFKD